MSEHEAAPRTGATARRQGMLEMVLDAGFLTTTELSDVFGVSEMTIRRDANRLVEAGMLRNVHGGVAALPASPVGSGRDYSMRARASSAAKRAIAREAVTRALDSEVVAFDAGTTCAAVAELFQPKRPVSVVSHSLIVINELSERENVTVIGTGGALHVRSKSFSGPQTVQMIRNLRIGTLFLAASGLDERGIYCGNEYDAETKRALLDASSHVVLVSDASKFGLPAMVRATGLDVVDEAVVDESISDEQHRMLVDAGIDVTVVPISG
ncbi:DeoR/GlpR family DNA-binding transcription regulator [Microbacterium sp. A84]|uniref:DeoR/GlpR family DNA-binding transcription regulator n=1 Tax=Microbacterium sp. A84 TaxID=3450715 RepID=UPI003F42D97F